MRVVGPAAPPNTTAVFSPANCNWNNRAFANGVTTAGTALLVGGLSVFSIYALTSVDATIQYIPVDADGVTELAPAGIFAFGITGGQPTFQALGGGFIVLPMAYVKLAVFGSAGAGNATLALYATGV